jgi:hypothetical protein
MVTPVVGSIVRPDPLSVWTVIATRKILRENVPGFIDRPFLYEATVLTLAALNA